MPARPTPAQSPGARGSAGAKAVDGVGDDGVDLQRQQHLRALGVVDGVDQGTHAGAMQLRDHRRVHHAVVGDDSDTAQCPGFVEPAVAQRLEQQRARQLRLGRLGRP